MYNANLVNSPSDIALGGFRDWCPSVDTFFSKQVSLVHMAIEAQMIDEERQTNIDLSSTCDLVNRHQSAVFHTMAASIGGIVSKNL